MEGDINYDKFLLLFRPEINEKIKRKKKRKIYIVIVLSLVIIATIFLVGHFKFNWFQKDIYNIDIEISRKEYIINYFNEKKTLKTIVSFTNGIIENNELNIFNNFMTIQIDKKKLKNNNFLYYFILAILDGKVKIQNNLKDITSFNISNISILNEFKSNPDGSKYPMAKFSFYENGTIDEIKLPNNMNNYYAHTIIELIDNIIPKLSRNRTEDLFNCLSINSKKYNNKKTLIEVQSPIEIKKYKGSQFTKIVERDIENGYLTNIRANSNITLKTQKDKGQVDFGLKDFNCVQKSEINSTGLKEEKKIVELMKKLAEYYTFINSEDLIQLLEDKEKDKFNEKINSSNSQIRKLVNSASSTFNLKTMNILGNDIDFKLYFGISGEKYSGALIISVGGIDYKFGTDDKSWSYSHYYGDWTLFNFRFPPPMSAIKIALKAGGTVSIGQTFNKKDPVVVINISGSILAIAEVTAGWDEVISISAKAKGAIISAEANGNINENKYMYYTGSIGGGDISVIIEGKALDHSFFKNEYQIWEGW